MFCFGVLIICLLAPARADPRTTTRRYKPLIHVTEEIDINDITFTTSAPAPHYYAAALRLKDAHTAPPDHPALRYKPYRLFKLHDPPRLHKPRTKAVEPPAAYSAPEPPKAKLVPFPPQLPPKAPLRTNAFIPSPTFSPTILAQITPDNTPKPPQPFPTTQTLTDWPKPTTNPLLTKHPVPTPDNHRPSPSPNPRRESPQHSESLLSEVSAPLKAPNHLDDMADSLDLKTGERVEFQMYGMDGPKSYKFGFDTGKGLNRHFRFEERDNTGRVKGHYGYLDEDGKMRIMKYEADPITGFHAGPVEVCPDDN